MGYRVIGKGWKGVLLKERHIGKRERMEGSLERDMDGKAAGRKGQWKGGCMWGYWNMEWLGGLLERENGWESY